MTEYLLPPALLARFYGHMARLAPSTYDAAMAAADQPWPHPPGCLCPGDLAARLTLAAPPPLDVHDPHDPHSTRTEHPMPKTPTTAERLPCAGCGVATPTPAPHAAPPPRNPERPMAEPPPRNWCDDCRAVLDQTDGTPRSRLLVDALGAHADGLDPGDPLVIRFAAEHLTLAEDDPAYVSANPAASVTGEPPYRPRPGSGTRRRWHHVPPEEREALALRLQRQIRDHGKPRRGKTPCAGCGLRRAVAWTRVTIGRRSWSLCGDCAEAYRRAGRTLDPDGPWSAAYARRLVGCPSTMAAPRLVPYCRTVTDPDTAPGCDTPGGYLGTGLVEVQRWAARRWPDQTTAPPEVRAEVTRAARIAAARARVHPTTVDRPLIRW